MQIGRADDDASCSGACKIGYSHKRGSANTLRIEAKEKHAGEIVMYEASDTGTENALMAAAKIKGQTTVKFASANYAIQDLCVFLGQCGVKIEGIGTTTLVVHGVSEINSDLTVYPSEDPIESMFFISLSATTKSKITIKRCPIDFLELELATLDQMGLRFESGGVYSADNGHTRLVDITVYSSELTAPPEKIAPRPYPGINIDNLPFLFQSPLKRAGALSSTIGYMRTAPRIIWKW